MPEPSPPVDAVAGLVLDMVDGTWPNTEDDRRDFYDRLGLTPVPWDTADDHREDPHNVWHRFETSLPGVHGMDTIYRGQFLGLSLFAYNELGDGGVESRVAFPELRRLISGRLGEPSEEWGSLREPACYWAIAPLQIEMYCFQRLASGVMVGPSHIDRAAANDQDAAESQPASQPRESGAHP